KPAINRCLEDSFERAVKYVAILLLGLVQGIFRRLLLRHILAEDGNACLFAANDDGIEGHLYGPAIERRVFATKWTFRQRPFIQRGEKSGSLRRQQVLRKHS